MAAEETGLEHALDSSDDEEGNYSESEDSLSSEEYDEDDLELLDLLLECVSGARAGVQVRAVAVLPPLYSARP